MAGNIHRQVRHGYSARAPIVLLVLLLASVLLAGATIASIPGGSLAKVGAVREEPLKSLRQAVPGRASSVRSGMAGFPGYHTELANAGLTYNLDGMLRGTGAGYWDARFAD